MFSHKEFLAALIADFPELSSELEEDSELPHVQMGTFAAFTNRAIASYDRETLKRAFQLARRCFHDADPGLKNEFYVSYLEVLDLDSEAGKEAQKITPGLFLKGWREINAYLDEIGAKSRDDRK